MKQSASRSKKLDQPDASAEEGRARELRFTARLVNQLDYRQRYFRFATRHIAERVLGGQDLVLRGESATTAMRSATEATVTMAREVAQRRDAFYWLERLRLVPLEMFGAGEQLKRDSYYEGQIMTETISAMTTKAPPVTLTPASDPMHDSDDAVEDLTRLLALGSLARHYKVMWRCAAKDIPVTVSPKGLAVPDKSTDAWSAVRLFDSRNNGDESRNLTLGTLATGKWRRSTRPDFMEHLIGLGPTGPVDSLDHITFVPYAQQFRLPALLRGYDWYQDELPLLFFLSQVLSLGLSAASPADRAAVMRLGYAGIKKTNLERLLREQTASEDWRRGLAATFGGFDPDRDLTLENAMQQMSVPGSIMPLRPGPVLRGVDSESWVIDHAALDFLLQSAIGPKQSRDEGAKNTRAADFEVRVQELVDRSPWAPPANVRALVGSKPKDSLGNIITDLDAIAALGDHCLLIDCKSFIPQLLNEGDFRATRNAASDLEKALLKWNTTTARVLSDAVDARYDVLRSYDRVTPIIVTPGVYFLPLHVAEDMGVDNLRSISSILELVAFMDSRAPQRSPCP